MRLVLDIFLGGKAANKRVPIPIRNDVPIPSLVVSDAGSVLEHRHFESGGMILLKRHPFKGG